MVEVAVWFIVVLFFIQMWLLIQLLVSKAERIQTDRMVESYYNRIFENYRLFLLQEKEEEPSFIASMNQKVRVVEKILHKVLDEEKDAAITRIQRTAHKHLSNPYKKFLKQGSWSQRVNSLYLIEDFQMSELKEEVWAHFQSLKKKEDEEYRQSLRVLASFQEERLIRFLTSPNELSQSLVIQLMRRLSSELIHHMVAIMNEEPDQNSPQVHTGLINYCGEAGDREFVPFLESNLHSPHKEIRLKALKSLAEIGECTNATIIADFSLSDSWEERMYAARLAGVLHKKEHIGTLLTLAGDAEWWVRYAACAALKKYPNGRFLLGDTASSHKDRYARDMAKQLLTVKVGDGKR